MALLLGTPCTAKSLDPSALLGVWKSVGGGHAVSLEVLSEEKVELRLDGREVGGVQVGMCYPGNAVLPALSLYANVDGVVHRLSLVGSYSTNEMIGFYELATLDEKEREKVSVFTVRFSRRETSRSEPRPRVAPGKH